MKRLNKIFDGENMRDKYIEYLMYMYDLDYDCAYSLLISNQEIILDKSDVTYVLEMMAWHILKGAQ